MSDNFISLYPYSLSEAKRLNEVDLWRESFRENIACKDAITNAIRQNFDGMHLNEGGLQDVLQEYGFKRVGHVLSATLQYKNYDGRFSPGNKAWASEDSILMDENTYRFVVDSHPAVLDGFVDQFRKELEAKQLFGPKDCDTIWQELEGRVLVMKPSTLKESYWSPENQLWYAEGGFGCSPTASGRAVYATCLGDGENHVRWNREDFLGVLKEDLLPDWAREQVDKLKSGQEIGPVDTGPAQVMNL